jgi:hypothetical protein
MRKHFKFMSGGNQYRLQAASLEEALKIAFDELEPTAEARAVILHTMVCEETAKKFSGAPDGQGAL